MTQQLTPEKIRAEVERFWKAFTSKSTELQEFYSFDANVFGSMATRPELGRLAAVRREREYFHADTTVTASVTSPVDVMVFGNVAVAIYTLECHVTNARVGIGRKADENIKVGRVTQVFAIEPDGELRIVHEHISEPNEWAIDARAQASRTSAAPKR